MFDALLSKVNNFLGYVEGLLQGEAARAIGYGAAVVIWLVAAVLGRLPNIPFDQALILSTTVITLLVAIIESIRKYVFSASTVFDLLYEVGMVPPGETTGPTGPTGPAA